MSVTIRQILVPVDFSEASLQALDYAIELAKPLRAALVVLFVVEPLYNAGDFGVLLEEQQRLGHEELARLAARLKQRDVTCRAVMRRGTPYVVIADEAERSRANLIVMATHGRTGLSHLVMGSVATKVVRTATCPVLTVHPKARIRRRTR